MSYLSSINRKERFPIEKSGNGNARRLDRGSLCRRTIGARPPHNARRTQRQAAEHYSREEKDIERKRHHRLTDYAKQSGYHLALGGAVAGQAAGRKIPPICSRRQPPTLGKRPTKSPPNVSDPNRQTANHRRYRFGGVVAPRSPRR